MTEVDDPGGTSGAAGTPPAELALLGRLAATVGTSGPQRVGLSDPGISARDEDPVRVGAAHPLGQHRPLLRLATGRDLGLMTLMAVGRAEVGVGLVRLLAVVPLAVAWSR